jgi:hypothetical protein
MPQKTTTSGSSSTVNEPWAPQKNYLLDAFDKAQQTYKNATGNIYSGAQLAQFNPAQLGLYRSMVGYGNNSDIPANLASTGEAATGAGMGAVGGSLAGLNRYAANSGAAENVRDAGMYADNPYISGQVDAAMRDARRGADESLYPQIARNAAIRNTTNSSTRSIREGMVDRGLAEKAGDISANLRGNAYNSGLQLAQADRNSRAAAYGTAGSLGGSLLNTGLGASTGSIGAQGNLFDMINAGGGGLRSSDQAGLDNSRAMSEYANSMPSDLLAKYYGIVGSNNWGGTSNSNFQSTQKVQASPWTIAGGVLGAAGSFGTGLGNFSNSSLGAKFFG